jgi:hypothetical protein
MGMCNSCPFNHTEESEMVQNYGCLRSKKEILQLKDETGHNWACHTNNKRVCDGLKKERDVSSGNRYLQPCENMEWISWDEEDLKPIIK